MASFQVEFKTLFNMYRRWEVDDRAVVLAPYGCDAVDTRYRQKLQFVGLVIDKDSKALLTATFPRVHEVAMG